MKLWNDARGTAFVLLIASLSALISACNQSAEEPSAAPSQVAVNLTKTETAVPPTATSTPTPTLQPTDTPTTVPSDTPTATASPSPTPTPTETPTATATPQLTLAPGEAMGAACSESMTTWLSLTKDLTFPERFAEADPVKTDEDFDVNTYFTAFNHLSMEPGYVLDFVYFTDGLGGKPLVYARPTDQKPYETYSEFIEAAGQPSYGERSYDYLEHTHDFLDYVRTDDTEEGYLQFLMLANLVDQFYLFWHALYNDAIFMCGEADMARVFAEVKNFNIELPEEVIEAAGNLNFEPTVLLEEETATVRYIYFTKWGGFIEMWYTLTREYPHQYVDSDGQLLIEYDCGILF